MLLTNACVLVSLLVSLNCQSTVELIAVSEKVAKLPLAADQY